DQEYARIKAQLDNSGLFTVNLQATEWVTFAQERVADVYPMYQLGWFPDFPDPDNYLSPFFSAVNFVNNHFDAADIQGLIMQESTEPDPVARVQALEQIQDLMAERYISTLPLLQGISIAVARNEVKGVDVTLDASFQFRYASLSK
ncbi:MAG: ABC transporter substrate-binding protein, partial [Propionibacteriaceae bacterium]|nr:ABC transporter substrate-binding protein [Propionibacteriaceae bacterium]